MKNIIIYGLHFSLCVIFAHADTLHDSQAVNYKPVPATTATFASSSLLSNEKISGPVHKNETVDIKAVQALNKPVGLGLSKVATGLIESADSTAIGNYLKAKKNEINTLIAEDTGVIAQTEKASH